MKTLTILQVVFALLILCFVVGLTINSFAPAGEPMNYDQMKEWLELTQERCFWNICLSAGAAFCGVIELVIIVAIVAISRKKKG